MVGTSNKLIGSWNQWHMLFTICWRLVVATTWTDWVLVLQVPWLQELKQAKLAAEREALEMKVRRLKDLLMIWSTFPMEIHDLGIKGIALGFLGVPDQQLQEQRQTKTAADVFGMAGFWISPCGFLQKKCMFKGIYVFSTTGFCVGKCANVNHLSPFAFVSDSILFLPERAWGKTWKSTGTEQNVGVRPVVCTIFTWTSPWRMVLLSQKGWLNPLPRLITRGQL